MGSAWDETGGGPGLVHIYCGDGKGKTTAAAGLALRALAHGYKVVFAQFLKNGGSGEAVLLSRLPGATVIASEKLDKFSFAMSEDEKRACREIHADIFGRAAELCASGRCDILVLDEIIPAVNTGLFDEGRLIGFLKNSPPRRPPQIEVVLTGRDPSRELIALADYVSDIKKLKHPYDRGVTARAGIEL